MLLDDTWLFDGLTDEEKKIMAVVAVWFYASIARKFFEYLTSRKVH